GVDPSYAVVDCPVGGVDLMVGFCHYLGVPCPESAAGHSFLAGGAPVQPHYVVSEGVPRRPGHRAVRNARYKLVHAPGGPNVEGLGLPDAAPAQPEALYDLVLDPDETRDLLAARLPPRGAHEAARTLRRALRDAVPGGAPPRQSAPVDRRAQERLRALGYLDD
ncbi:MAG: hypothetical protein ACQGVC_25280, partial [Myxococcota bacterium]